MVLLVAALMLGGCSEVNKGSAKGADFERALRARVGPSIESVSIAAENVLPFAGTFHAKVTLSPKTSTADLATAEAAVAELVGTATAEVWANGIEICSASDAKRTPHLALRGQLLASSTSLLGALACEDGYAGELVDLTADIPAVQSAVAKDDSLRDLRVEGHVTYPFGDVDGLWRELAPHVAQAVGAVDELDLNTFELTGSGLTIDVQPGVDGAKVRAAVAAVAPEVVLTLTEGAGNGGDDLLAGAAALRTRLGALPGVYSVRFASPRQLVVCVDHATDVSPTVAAGLPLVVAAGPLNLHVTTQGSDNPSWTVDSGADFEVSAGQAVEHLDNYSALLASGELSAIGWREGEGRDGAPMVTISAPPGGDLRTVLPLVKENVPVGTTLNLHLGDEDYSFDVARRLESGGKGSRALPENFVETWNALP
ncbi:hypothetical protein ACOCJ7_11815 [Knoellia sp. CPCC 206453]|uniref:hypothetical protein n=1 Tax=Knoellia pratensis TaxID=3404796 RepID=UPI00361254D0